MTATRREVMGMMAGTALFFRASLGNAALAAQRRLGSMPDPVSNLEQAFQSPPDATRPYVLWMWMGSNISQSGITADLEAMKAAGIGGATIYSLADTVSPFSDVIFNSPTPEIVTYHEPWWVMVRHAASECRRLGLELILHNCAGYESSGGPWITPEMSMQDLIWSEHPVRGGRTIKQTIARAIPDPMPHQDWPIVYIPSEGKEGIPVSEARKTYYRDIAVIALPARGTPALTEVFDLTNRMTPDGELTWEAPEGDWVVYRFGHTSTGAIIEPAQWAAMGLECDKMSVEAVTFHCKHVLDDIRKHVGDLIGNPGLSTFYFDSYEAGTPTWTPKMPEEFKSRRGYDLIPYLPAMAGRKLVSDAETAKFQADWKQTVSDLFRDHYWATPRKLAHEYGMEFVAEPYEGPWDTREVVKFLDHANMEFWTNDGRYTPTANRTVNDTAHLLGQRIVGAEAFTTQPNLAGWQATPAWMKPIGDAAFCDGVNRMNIHHFVQQPWDPRYRPGNAMGQWGLHMGRYQTWWEPGKAFFRYLWRCQTLLQTGEFVPASTATSATFSTQQGTLEMQSIHRIRGREAIYFVANVARTGGTASCSFPVGSMQPELWDPVWGTMRDLERFESSSGRVTFLLDFAPAQSCFIVFRKPLASGGKGRPNSPRFTPLLELAGSWQVEFDPVWGGPASIQLEALRDWSKHPDPGVKYYSGTAIYRKEITLPAVDPAKKLWLDLGIVKDIATVTVNGKDVGVVWTAPWRIDLSDTVRSGANRIEIAVANTWANRLIGDEQQPLDFEWTMGDPKMKGGYFMRALPEWFLKKEPRPSKGRYTFTTWNYFHDRQELLPSGLLGPVSLLVEG